MTDQKTPRDCLVEGIRLIRTGQSKEALRMLEHATTDKSLRYAPSVLKVAQAHASGIQTVNVSFSNESFQFCLHNGNLGLDLHHVEGNFFETEELSYCKSIIPHRSNIVDVGANTGNHLIFFLGLLHPSLIIPIEPVPQAVEILKKNLELNGMSVDPRGLGIAAGKEPGELVLNLDAGSDLVVASVRETATADGRHRVKCVRLDDLVSEKIDFLKIDVEGFEKHVLAGATRILSEDKPLLMIEMHERFREELLKILETFNYKAIREFPGVGYKNVFCRVQ